MFYNYLKSMHYMVENYNANSKEFTKMLKINGDLIGKLNNSKSSVKSKTNSNKALTGGSVELDQLNIMKNMILKILEEFETNTCDTSELTQKVLKIKNTLELLIRYIDYLHSLVPTQDNLNILSLQLQEMNTILSKY